MLGPCFRLVLEDLSQNSSIISENKARKKGFALPLFKKFFEKLGHS